MAGCAGAISLAHGAAFPPVLELASVFPENGGDGSAGFVLIGIDGDDYAGFSGSRAGDLNGDGIDDVIMGAPGASPGRASLRRHDLRGVRVGPGISGGVAARESGDR